MSTSTTSSVTQAGTSWPAHAAVRSAPAWSLAAALLGFFVVTLDAVIVNVALPDIRRELAGGMSGLQWVVDGYALMFAALLLSAGSLSDRLGARRAFGGGLMVFVLASTACGLAPSLPALVAARFVQGAAAAAMMPSSMALVSHAYPDPVRRARAVALWSMGGVVMALLLHAVAARQAGVTSGVFNTSRQVGGALAVAVFGGLLASRATFVHGLRVSLLIAATVALGAAAVSLLLRRRT